MRPALIADVDEHALAHVAVGGDAAGHGDLAALGVIGAGLGAVFGGRELVPERVDALGPQGAQLGLALLDQ